VQLFAARKLLPVAQAEVSPKAVLDEILLLPAVEIGIKCLLKSQRSRVTFQPGHPPQVQPGDLPKRLLVEEVPLRPRSLAKAPEINLPEVFHPDEPLLRVVMEKLRNAHANLHQKRADIAVV